MDKAERAWLDGNRAAWTSLLAEAMRNLGHEGRTPGSFVVEREQAVAMLRQVCAEFGDNDWSDGLHLSDVIEKHLLNHLIEREDSDG